MQLLAISGSLRAASSNTALLQALALLAPPDVEVKLYQYLHRLPQFNPDLDGENVDPAVRAWRAQLVWAHGIIISSPEYAHGVPGSLKNGLDWVVGSNELNGKPVAFFNASARGTYAQASLAETIRTMSARVMEQAGVTVALLGKSLDAAAIAAEPVLADPLRRALTTFQYAIEHLNTGAPLST